MNISKKTKKFEEQYGSIALLKVAISTINRIIIGSNICSKKEFLSSFLKELKTMEKLLVLKK